MVDRNGGQNNIVGASKIDTALGIREIISEIRKAASVLVKTDANRSCGMNDSRRRANDETV